MNGLALSPLDFRPNSPALGLAMLLAPDAEADASQPAMLTIGPPQGMRSERLEGAWAWSLPLWARGLLGARALRPLASEEPRALGERLGRLLSGEEHDPLLAARIDGEIERLACERSMLAVRERSARGARAKSVRFALPIAMGMDGEEILELRDACEDAREALRYQVGALAGAIREGREPELGGLKEVSGALAMDLRRATDAIEAPRGRIAETVVGARLLRPGDTEAEIRARVAAMGVAPSRLKGVLSPLAPGELAPQATVALDVKPAAWDAT